MRDVLSEYYWELDRQEKRWKDWQKDRRAERLKAVIELLEPYRTSRVDKRVTDRVNELLEERPKADICSIYVSGDGDRLLLQINVVNERWKLQTRSYARVFEREMVLLEGRSGTEVLESLQKHIALHEQGKEELDTQNCDPKELISFYRELEALIERHRCGRVAIELIKLRV